MNSTGLVPASYHASRRDSLAIARDQQADGSAFDSIFRGISESAGTGAQQSKVRRNLSTAADLSHRMPNATDLAVSDLSSLAPMKAPTAAAAADQKSESSSPAEQEPATTREGRSNSRPTSASTAIDRACDPKHASDNAIRTEPSDTQATAPQSRNDASRQQTEAQSTPSDAQGGQPLPAAAPKPSPLPSTTSAAAVQAVQSASSATADAPHADASPRAVTPVGEAKGASPAGRSAPQPKAPAASRPDAEKLMAQFGRGLAAALRQNGGTVTIRLQPQELGDLKIRVQLQNGRVDARFEAATEHARDLLDQNLHSLRSALETRGLTVDRLDVMAAEKPAPSEQSPSNPGSDHSGPGFANDQSHHAGGEPGAHGWTGAESARSGVARDLAPDAAAEPVEEFQPDRSGIAPGRAVGGAPTSQVGLDAVA